MQAIVVKEAGGPSKLTYEERPLPVVKAGWSLIKFKAFGLNHAESITRAGGSPTVKFPRVIGIEAVGVIADSTSEALPVGMKVMTLMGEMGRQFDGSYAEYGLIPNEQIYPLDIDLPWTQLATIPESGYTAYGSIKLSKIKAGQHVLLRGGTSSVGLAALKILKALHVQVAASTRSLEKIAFLKAEGADEAILDQDGVLQTTEYYDAIIDFVGSKSLVDSLGHLKSLGGYITVTGELADEWSMKDFSAFMIPTGSYLTNFQSTLVNRIWLAELVKLIADNDLQFPIGAVFAFTEIVAAHELLDSGQANGKIIVEI